MLTSEVKEDSPSLTFCPKHGHLTFSQISYSTAKVRPKHLNKSLLEARGRQKGSKHKKGNLIV